MKKVFLDTDVVLDLLLDRAPFSDDVEEIFEEASQRNIVLCISSNGVTNINYIIERIEGRAKTWKKTAKVLQLVFVENVDNAIIRNAINSSFKDFEDAVQHYCAVASKLKAVVTRNTRDFKQSTLSVFTPIEFLTYLHND